SEFAGTAREFQEALQVNPYARADFAEVIRVALEMPVDEQRRRMTRMKAQVIEHNVYGWAASLITEMAQTVNVPLGELTIPPNFLTGRMTAEKVRV
ncbi:MAG: trehalose-6-phosphate synthase, partial [Deltaproteobacteria bacterium]|nr:trehalose-6-phosphate synthase [Deltaproteobacteria bacterium]